jgi:DNA-binding response OmpR family regulator
MMDSMRKTVAVVDDEHDILDLVSFHLERAGFNAKCFSNASEFLDSLKETLPDLLILDLMLPDMHGTEVCRRLRLSDRTSTLPIIMLTAMVDEPDRVTGLEMGADDYVTKPFSPRELTARVRAVLRRTLPSEKDRTVIDIGGRIVIEPDRFRIKADGRQVDLTPTEFRIIQILAEAKGRIFSRGQLLETLWHGEKFVFERTIDVHIRHIRQKLGDAGSIIRSVHGIGYKLEESG